VFVAPRAAEDRHRIAALQATESLLGGAAPARIDALTGAPDATRVTAAPASADRARFCTTCGTKAAPEAKFCSACGTALPTT